MEPNKTSSLTSIIIKKELTYDLRKKILWPHITNNDYSINVDNNPNTFHMGTFINKEIISIGTFVKENNSKIKPDNQYRLRAMATDINYQKIGAGKNLMLKAFQVLKKKKNQHTMV